MMLELSDKSININKIRRIDNGVDAEVLNVKKKPIKKPKI